MASPSDALEWLSHLDSRRQALGEEADRIDGGLTDLRGKRAEAKALEDALARAHQDAWDAAYLEAKGEEGVTEQMAKSRANLATRTAATEAEEAKRVRERMDRARADKYQRLKAIRSEEEALTAQCYVLNSEIKNLGG